MNKKGQTLYTFLMILPIIVAFILIIFNYAMTAYQVKEVDKAVSMTIEDYYDKALTKTEVQELIDKNLEYEDLTIIVDKSLIVMVEVKLGGIHKSNYLIRYVGTLKNGEVIVEKGMS